MKTIVPEQSMSWQRPVIDCVNEGTETKGNRYIVGDAPTNNFAGFSPDSIVWFDGTTWHEIEPSEGWIAFVTERGGFFYYTMAPSELAWIELITGEVLTSPSANWYDEADLILWIDAADTDSYTVDGSNNLLTLTDKSPSPCTISFPASKAPVKNTVAALNGNPIFQFDGGKKIKTDRVQANDENTIFMVVRFDGTGGNNGSVLTHDLSDSGAAATYNHFIFGVDGATTLMREYVGNGSAFDNPISGSTINFNQWYIFAVRNTGSHAYGFLNGAAHADGAHTKTENITLSVADQGYRPFSGYLAELIVFSTDIGETRRAEIEDYLNTKYSVY